MDYGDTWQNISDGIQNNFSLNLYLLKSDKEGNVMQGVMAEIYSFLEKMKIPGKNLIRD